MKWKEGGEPKIRTLTCQRVGKRGRKKEPEETEQENTKEENQGRMVSQKLMRQSSKNQ